MMSNHNIQCNSCQHQHSEISCTQGTCLQCCSALSGISNVDQGYFQNVGSKKILDGRKVLPSFWSSQLLLKSI